MAALYKFYYTFSDVPLDPIIARDSDEAELILNSVYNVVHRDKYKLVRTQLYHEDPKPPKSEMLSWLKEYLSSASKEELQKDWQEIKDMKLSGPTVEEFIKNQNEHHV